MINLIAESGGTSPIIGHVVGLRSVFPIFGYTVPGYLPGIGGQVCRPFRSELDYLHTGPAKAYGDHDCTNLQISGNLHVKPSIIGVDTQAWSPSYGITPGTEVVPDSVSGYSISQIKALFGSTWSDQHIAVHRDMDAGVALKSLPQLPLLLSGSGVARSYGAKNGSNMAYYALQEASLSATVIRDGANGKLAVFWVAAIWLREFDYFGNPGYSAGSAQAYLYTLGPSSSGASDLVAWYPNSSTGVWSTAYSPVVLPPFLKSFTRTSFESFMVDPSQLTSWSPAGIGAVGIVPDWTPKTVPVAYLNGNVTVTAPDIDSSLDCARLAVRDYFSPLLPAILSLHGEDDWQDLGDTAADNLLQVSVNHYANAMQAKKTLSILKDTLCLLKDWKDPKAWANWWLSLRYGDRLLLDDATSVVKGVLRETKASTKVWNKDFQVTHSRSTSTCASPWGRIPSPKVTHNLKMYYTFRQLGWWGEAYTFARKWGLWPTTAAGWDIIPFSFVVDWFVDVQSLFEEIDRDTLLQYVDVTSVITTEKRIFDFGDVALDGFTLSGATFTHYARSIGTHLPSGPFRIDKGHSSSVNVVDGTSLVIQVLGK